MRKSLLHRLLFIGLTLTVLFASIGFMTIVESRCKMMDDPSNKSCPMMSCCGNQNSRAEQGPSFKPPSGCHVLTLAGLPSILISIPASRQSDAKIDFSHQNYLTQNIPDTIGNPQSEIRDPFLSPSPPSRVARYVLISAFLI